MKKNSNFCTSPSNLEIFLESRGFNLTPNYSERNTGYITPAQKEQFTKQLAKHPHLRKIGEIGFNAGHSAEHFFSFCELLEHFFSFDMNAFPYTAHAVQYFYNAYPNRFTFIMGDSLVKVPEIHRMFPDLKFDLIFIDGCHRFDWVMGDIMNARQLATPDTLLWIDDASSGDVSGVIKFCQTLGWIEIKNEFSSDDPRFGTRDWIEAKYRF